MCLSYAPSSERQVSSRDSVRRVSRVLFPCVCPVLIWFRQDCCIHDSLLHFSCRRGGPVLCHSPEYSSLAHYIHRHFSLRCDVRGCSYGFVYDDELKSYQAVDIREFLMQPEVVIGNSACPMDKAGLIFMEWVLSFEMDIYIDSFHDLPQDAHRQKRRCRWKTACFPGRCETRWSHPDIRVWHLFP